MLKNRQDACSTKIDFSCGVGILPARPIALNKLTAAGQSYSQCFLLV